MSLEKGAETIVNQCLKIGEDENVLVLNDGNDKELVNALISVLSDKESNFELLEYPEPGNHGEEPPEYVAEAMKKCDVFIAPTKKSISHTKARIEANQNGSRGVTLPGINKEIWNTSLQADYNEVKRITDKAWKILAEEENIRVETPSGTDLKLEVDMEYFDKDIGLVHEPGDFGNLPAGEVDGGVLEINGTLVVDHLPFVNDSSEGTKVEVKSTEVVAVEADEENRLTESFDNVEGFKNIAEFGFGTNPEATLIGNILQDEKILGTIHIAFGDNTSYFPEDHERYNPCEMHWDTVCKKPTVWFGDTKVLDEGEPVFLD